MKHSRPWAVIRTMARKWRGHPSVQSSNRRESGLARKSSFTASRYDSIPTLRQRNTRSLVPVAFSKYACPHGSAWSPLKASNARKWSRYNGRGKPYPNPNPNPNPCPRVRGRLSRCKSTSWWIRLSSFPACASWFLPVYVHG